MYSNKINKEFSIILKSLENAYSEIINSMNNFDNFLDKNCNITQEEKFYIEDFLIYLDIIRSKTKDSIYLLKKFSLEQNKKVLFFQPKEFKDISISSEFRIDDIFNKDYDS